MQLFVVEVSSRFQLSSVQVPYTCQRCADMYPRIDILRTFAILTDTDRIRIAISLFKGIPVDTDIKNGIRYLWIDKLLTI